MKLLPWIIIVMLLMCMADMYREEHKCSLRDIPSEEVVRVAKGIIASTKTYGALENMSLRQLEWYLDKEPDKVMKYWEIYMAIESFK